MLEKLEILRMAQGMATHAAARQSAIAQNVANADTPGFRARDLASFTDSYRAPDAGAMRTTRAGHLTAGTGAHETAPAREVYRPGAASPNGNTVSLESEMMQATLVKADHDRALAIYKSAMNILRTSAGSTR